MNPRLVIRVIATVQILVGALSFPLIWLQGFPFVSGGWNEETFVSITMLWAVASAAAGVAMLFRPVVAAVVSVILLAPQAVSFAVGSILYAVSLWPNLGLEIIVPGIEDLGMTSRISIEPTLRLSNGHDYIGFGIGFNLVAIAAMVLLTWAATRLRRSGSAPL